ncbi:glycosyltransferase [Pontibacter ramchanderi]|uniref:Glycosyl transferase family 8 n=1 Tax=Pontibacter ramchanderi TaxID=1179743 RepID=A0A2N3V1N1_9BACT|nr:glycosyltransferase [Pontibacter ramchanderi]PKV75524.1 hypothetical protein BD749_0466 [Pontibacter ramchanderi]
METAIFKEAVVTLFEKDYHKGVASLINSLHKSEFEGLVYVGYRGALPEWVSQLEPLNNGYYKLQNIHTKFVQLECKMHFGYYKPTILRSVLNEFPSVEKVYYFDPDIVVNAPWSYFTKWVDSGIGLCLDNCFPFVHHNHPWRKEWKRLSNSNLVNHNNFYVNSGFVGIERSNRVLLDRWVDLTQEFSLTGGNTSSFEKDGFRAIKGDQDILNAVIAVSPDLSFSIIGQEGMGFTQPAYLMSHAVNGIKPWNKSYLAFLFKRGRRPDFSDKDYIKYANSPIQVFSGRSFKFRKLDLKIASILGRLIG